MALTPNLIPSQITTYPCPYDATLAFCSAQVLTTQAGILLPGNVNATIDLGGSNPQSAAGRADFIWNMDFTAMDFTSGDESYKFYLLGSNDVAFGAGNVEELTSHSFGAVAAGRSIAAIMGASPTIPPPNLAGTIVQLLATNLMQRIYYRYLKVWYIISGTTPTTTVTSWISRANIDV